jgi:hypothetical protein
MTQEDREGYFVMQIWVSLATAAGIAAVGRHAAVGRQLAARQV